MKLLHAFKMGVLSLAAGLIAIGCAGQSGWVVSRHHAEHPAKPAGCHVEWSTLRTDEILAKYDILGIVRVPEDRASLALGAADRAELERAACELGGEAISAGAGGGEAEAYAVLAAKRPGAAPLADPALEAADGRGRGSSKPIINLTCMSGCMADCRGQDGKFLRICVSSCKLWCTEYL